MGVDGKNLEIVRTIVTLAHSMSMDVTAEGKPQHTNPTAQKTWARIFFSKL